MQAVLDGRLDLGGFPGAGDEREGGVVKYSFKGDDLYTSAEELDLVCVPLPDKCVP